MTSGDAAILALGITVIAIIVSVSACAPVAPARAAPLEPQTAKAISRMLPVPAGFDHAEAVDYPELGMRCVYAKGYHVSGVSCISKASLPASTFNLE